MIFWGANALLLALTAMPAHAGGGYYVEVGRDTTLEEASNEWNALVASHKSLLGKLQFYPKSVYQGGVAVSTRIQAGPISNKVKAQKICARLFANDVPCFVIEGVEDAPPTAMMNLSEKAEQQASNEGGLPWAHSSEVGAAPSVRAISALPWLTNQQEQENMKALAQVQVAEAIRVPLSGTVPKDPKVTVKPLPEPHPTFHKPFAESKPASAADGAGWLTVDAFPNEDIATSFWEEVRTSVPKKQTSALRVRITRPLMTQKQGKASLNVGPFASSSEAYAFCDAIQARERGLNCSYLGSDPGVSETVVGHADGYNARRSTLARRRPMENPPSDLMPAAGPSKQYWVQVVQAASQMEALNQWNAMRASNDDLLNGMRSSVSASATDKNTFVVRVGPIANNDDAIRFCAKLQERGVDCRVLLYSTRL